MLLLLRLIWWTSFGIPMEPHGGKIHPARDPILLSLQRQIGPHPHTIQTRSPRGSAYGAGKLPPWVRIEPTPSRNKLSWATTELYFLLGSIVNICLVKIVCLKSGKWCTYNLFVLYYAIWIEMKNILWIIFLFLIWN